MEENKSHGLIGQTQHKNPNNKALATIYAKIACFIEFFGIFFGRHPYLKILLNFKQLIQKTPQT